METINDRMELIINERFDGNKAAFAKKLVYLQQVYQVIWENNVVVNQV